MLYLQLRRGSSSVERRPEEASVVSSTLARGTIKNPGVKAGARLWGWLLLLQRAVEDFYCFIDSLEESIEGWEGVAILSMKIDTPPSEVRAKAFT